MQENDLIKDRNEEVMNRKETNKLIKETKNLIEEMIDEKEIEKEMIGEYQVIKFLARGMKKNLKPFIPIIQRILEHISVK